MRKRIPLLVVLAVGLAALAVSEWRKEKAEVSPRSLLNFLADTQREITRLPMRATRLSDAEEIAIGDRMARSHYDWIGSSQEQSDPTQQYITRVGERVAIRAHRKLPYRFHFINDPDLVNAFALPGGHIFVGGGLLALMKTEDELAAVLGHEIIHVDRYHCAERVQIEARVRKVPLGALASLPVRLFQAGYTKAQEFEADHEGVHLMVRASYSPLGAISLQKTFDNLRSKHDRREPRSPQEELSQVARQVLQDYFRSHPLPQERIARIEALIRQNGWENKTKTIPLGLDAGKKVK